MYPKFLIRLLAWKPGGYLRSSGALLFWLLTRAAGQAILFLAVARALGAEGYGVFISALAIISFFTPLATFGMPAIIVRNIARQTKNLSSQVGIGIALWLRLSPPLILIAALGSYWVIPSPPAFFAIAFVAAAEIGAISLVELLSRAEQAQQHISKFGVWMSGLVFARLAAFSVYTISAEPTTEGWMWVYGASSAGYAIYLWVHAGKPKSASFPPRIFLKTAVEGFPFAFASLAVRVQTEFNKPVMAQFSFSSTGNFSAAQRVVEMASLPLVALQEALWPRIFAGRNTFQQFIFPGFFLFSLALVAGASLWMFAPILPKLIGEDFEQTISVLRWLAWIPAIQVIRNLSSIYHINNNISYPITRAYAGGTIISIITTPWLIWRYEMAGAVTAMYLTEMITAVLQINSFRRPRNNL